MEKPTISKLQASYFQAMAGFHAMQSVRASGDPDADLLDAAAQLGGHAIGRHRFFYTGGTLVLQDKLFDRYQEAGRIEDIGAGHYVLLLARPERALELLKAGRDLDEFEGAMLAEVSALTPSELREVNAWFAEQRAKHAPPLPKETPERASPPAQAGQAG